MDNNSGIRDADYLLWVSTCLTDMILQISQKNLDYTIANYEINKQSANYNRQVLETLQNIEKLLTRLIEDK